MALLRRSLILLPHLDGLIRLSTDQSQPGAIERRAHDPSLGIQAARLSHGVQTLKSMPRLPVPEADASIIRAREEDVILIDGERVDDGIVTLEILHEGSFRALPLLDGARAGGGESEFFRVYGEGTDALLVMSEHAHGLAGGEIPEADGGVEGGGDDLRVGFLTFEVRDGSLMAGENVDIASGAHVPDAGDAIAAACDEYVEGGVEGEGVDAAEVAVVVADHFVGFEIPALDHLVLAAGEKVGMAR